MNQTIRNFLYPLGITANYTGYYYLIYAIELTAKDPSHLMFVTKDLYPTVARYFSTTASRVERNLRHMGSLAWDTNPELLIHLAGHPLMKRPPTAQFIAILSAAYKKALAGDVPASQRAFF